MSDKQALRTQILTQTDPLGSKPRFGLFSQPISIAIGDDGPYKSKLHGRNEQGKPITKQRNFQTSPTRTGQLRTSFLGPLNSLATHTEKDIYIDPARRVVQEENIKFSKGKRPQIFVPSKLQKTLATASYPYKEENRPELMPKRNRREDGTVKVELTNFYTNPGSKVINKFFKHINYIADPYERAKQQEIQLMKKNKSLEGEAAFKPNCFVTKVLNKQKNVYGQDVQLKPKQPKQSKFKIYKHQAAWRSSNPNKQGIYGYLQPYPKYMGNPPRQLKRKASISTQKQTFKSMNASLTTPTPSITQNPINLRKSVNHSFCHRF